MVFTRTYCFASLARLRIPPPSPYLYVGSLFHSVAGNPSSKPTLHPPCSLLTFASIFAGHEAASTRSDVEQHLRRRGFVGLDANATRDAIAKEVREVEAMMHKKAWQSKAKGRGRSRRAGVRIADLKERRGIQEMSKTSC